MCQCMCVIVKIMSMSTHSKTPSVCCRRLVTCGNDCDVTTFVGLEDEEKSEFSLSSSKLSALACYSRAGEGGVTDIIAVAMDDNTVQAFTTKVATMLQYGSQPRPKAPSSFLRAQQSFIQCACGGGGAGRVSPYYIPP